MTVLDLDRLAKVRALHDSTNNPGEKAAAATRMRVIAEKAGLTVTEAVSKLDASAPKPMHDAFAGSAFAKAWADLMNSPEQRAADARRAAEREALRQEAIAEHGSQEAVFSESPWEVWLRQACEPLAELHPVHGYVSKLDGWDGCSSKIPVSVRAAVSAAYRLPRTVAEAWGEVQHWENSHDQRCAFDRDYGPWHWTRARQQVVEELCDTLPAVGIEDLQARVGWLRHVNNLGWSRDVHEDNVLIDRLAADVASMAGVVTALAAIVERAKGSAGAARSSDPGTGPVQNGHPPRTRGERRQAVLALFGQDLTDREIARRVGVSPQTVGNLRRAAQAGR